MDTYYHSRGYSSDALEDLYARAKTNPEEYYKFFILDKEVMINCSPYFYAYKKNDCVLKYGYHLMEKPIYHIKLLNVDMEGAVRPNLGRFRYSYYGNYDTFEECYSKFLKICLDLLVTERDKVSQLELF